MPTADRKWPFTTLGVEKEKEEETVAAPLERRLRAEQFRGKKNNSIPKEQGKWEAEKFLD